MKTLLWHDYETWGINPKVDFPAQFAAVRTDLDFNIIGEPIVLYATPPKDRLPNPTACLITGLTPQQIETKHEYLPEVEFIKKINQLMSEPGTCSLGFNNIRFDDEVTRFTLYRNFLDPYAREWQNGCTRWDLIDVVRLARALRPEGINWPFDKDLRPSNKLELLTKANQIEHSAHDALADVYATIAVAKLVRQNQPKLYDYAFKNRHKNAISKVLNIKTPKMSVHISGMYPAEIGNFAIVAPIANNPSNKNAITVFDLNNDPEILLGKSTEELHYLTFTKDQDLKPNETRLPIKDVHINKCPVLVPTSTLTPEIIKKYQINLEKCALNLEKLTNIPELNHKLQQVYTHSKFGTESDAELALYDGFIPDKDRNLCNYLHSTTPEKWQDFQFQDQRLQQLWFRFKARNYPSYLTQSETKKWQEFCQVRINHGLKSFEDELQKLNLDPSLTPTQKQILQELQDLPQQILQYA